MNLTMSTSGFWDKLERVTQERDELRNALIDLVAAARPVNTGRYAAALGSARVRAEQVLDAH
jgi:hypothetical protein